MTHITQTFNQSPVTMSSKEIADLVEARHNDVLATIARLFDKGLLRSSRKTERVHTGGRPIDVFHLTERDTHLVVAGYSDEHRARVIDRWQELESKAAPSLPDFSDPVAAARAWADELEQKRAAMKQLEAAKPAVEFVDRYVSSDSGNKGFRQVAKLLNANEREFRQFLADEKIMYRLGGEWMPYQSHIDAGRFVVKTGVAENEHAYNNAKFTPKGVNWVAGRWVIHNLQEAA